jgi:hypothetical protein
MESTTEFTTADLFGMISVIAGISNTAVAIRAPERLTAVQAPEGPWPASTARVGLDDDRR